MLLQLSQYQLTIDLLEEPSNIDYSHFIPTPYNFTKWEDAVRMVQQYLTLLTCQTRKLFFRTPPLFVIDDSSWKNAAESFTVALTLTLKCNSSDFYRTMRLNRDLAIGNFDEEMLYLKRKMDEGK